jgi:hypothetical protein
MNDQPKVTFVHLRDLRSISRNPIESDGSTLRDASTHEPLQAHQGQVAIYHGQESTWRLRDVTSLLDEAKDLLAPDTDEDGPDIEPEGRTDRRRKITPKQKRWIIEQHFTWRKSLRTIADLVNTPQGKLSKSQVHNIIQAEKQARAEHAEMVDRARQQHRKLSL